MSDMRDGLFSPRPRIISVSRRTDIPAFHSGWFMERLREGSVTVRHPYSRKESVVSLNPEDVYGFVFWSRNYAPLLPHLDEIEKVSRRLFFHFTITGLPKGIERNTPARDNAVRDFRRLSRRYSPAHLVWRFDPLCVTDRISFDDVRRNFMRIARELEGSCTMCYTSLSSTTARPLRTYTIKAIIGSLSCPMRRNARLLANLGGQLLSMV